MPLSVILVHPEIPQNVGFTARSMKGYLLDDLRIVGRRYPETSLAFKTGAPAKELLQGAGYFKTLEEALGNIHFAAGFTCRKRDEELARVEKFSDMAPSFDYGLNLALVFGRESRGLLRDECLLMNRLVRIELPNDSYSLNLSHAVTVVLHEIFSHTLISGNPLIPARKNRKKAARMKTVRPESWFSAREETFTAFLDVLRKRGIYRGEKETAHVRYLRKLWQRLEPDEQERHFLAGIMRKVMK